MKAGNSYQPPNLDDPDATILVQCWCRGGYVEQTIAEWKQRQPPICDRDGCGPWGRK